MPKRSLDADDCNNDGTGEAASILTASVIGSSSSTELEDRQRVSNKDVNDEDDDDGDRQSESSAVLESSASDDTSLPTDGSTDTADPCSTGDCSRLAKSHVKKSVSFDDVTVYYFPRVQGFTCVPSQGGSTLGMGDRHTTVEKYSLMEHAQLRHSLHHNILLEHQRQGRILLPANFSSEPPVADTSEWTLDDYYFLQPVPSRQRRSMLREAGVARIDPMEREECRSLRLSRSRCGCSCREVCRPPSCPCCRSGIGCQVDQMAYPCSCSHAGCANPHGRIEFNAARVRAHFIRTLLQLGLQQQNSADESDSESSSPPEKRRCLDSDQLPSSASLLSLSAFSSSSTSSLFPVCSTDANNASASSTNGLETQRVYFDTVERLPGTETVVVAYDEEYDDDEDDEDSSETSSDGDDASFDGISDNADGETTAVTNDPRQRTLDDYVIRFRRQQTCTEPEASNCSTAGVDSGFHFTPLPTLQPIPSKPSEPSDSRTATFTNGFQFTPLPIPRPLSSNSSSAPVTAEFQFAPLPVPQSDGHAGCSNSAGMSTGFQLTPLPVLQPSPSTANVTNGFQFSPLPVPPSLTKAPTSSMLSSIAALNSSLNAHLNCMVTCPGMTRQCPTTLSSSVNVTHTNHLLLSKPSVYDLPNDTKRDHALPGEGINACSVMEAIDNNCSVPLATTCEFRHVSPSTDGATYDCFELDNYKQNSCTLQETTDNCLAQRFNATSDSAASCSAQQRDAHIQSSSDDTKHGGYSLPEDTAMWSQSVAPGNWTPESTAQGSSELDVRDSHSTGHQASLGLDTGDHAYSLTSDTAVGNSQDSAYGLDDTVLADSCKIDDNAKAHPTVDSGSENDTSSCCVLDVEGMHGVSLVRDDTTYCDTTLDAQQCILPGNTSTNSRLMTEANGGDNSVVYGHYFLDDTSPGCTAAAIANIVCSCSSSENATDGENVPDDAADGCSMPHDPGHGSSVPDEDAGSSSCVSDNTATVNDCWRQ